MSNTGTFNVDLVRENKGVDVELSRTFDRTIRYSGRGLSKTFDTYLLDYRGIRTDFLVSCVAQAVPNVV